MSLEALKKHIDQLKKDEKNSHGFRAASSFLMLEHVDLMIDDYVSSKETHKGAVLLDIFGVLQGLFVAIDALYDLAIGLTQYKYHININQNPVLHELKYIRNDIVGHPTHRTYPNGGTGFSMFAHDELTKDKITYKTYIYSKNKLDIQKKDVHFKTLFDQYHIEKDKILEDVYAYMVHSETETKLPEKIYTLYETLSLNQLEQIETDFKKIYELKDDSSHRFLWRASLLKKCIAWEHDDQDLKQLILYISKLQASKLYDMALDLENRKGQDLYTPIPKILYSFYKFLRKHENEALVYLDHLRDFSHPLFKEDVQALLDLKPSKDAEKVINFLKVQNDADSAYLIGSVLRAYRPKNTSK